MFNYKTIIESILKISTTKVRLVFIGLIISQSAQASSVRPVKLECEHMINPVGIDAPQSRFTWKLSDARPGAMQTACQVIVGADSLKLSKGINITWQTAKISSSEGLVTYQGKGLKLFTKYYWMVRLWDKHGKQIETEPIASFETGMIQVRNWQGFWISDPNSISTKPAAYFSCRGKISIGSRNL